MVQGVANNVSTIDSYLRTVECVQLAFENTQCLFNKLVDSNEKTYFKNFNFLMEHLNSASQEEEANDQVTLTLSTVLKKIQLIQIKVLQSKFILDTNKLKYEKIKLDELHYQNRSNLSIARHHNNNKNQSDEELIQFLVKKVDYSTESQQKYSLLNRFSISLNQPAQPGSEQHLAISCENANIYLHIDFIKNFIHSKFFKSIVDSYVNNSKPSGGGKKPINLLSKFVNHNSHDNSENSSPLVFKFKMDHSYVHLINLPDQSRLSFSAGAAGMMGPSKVGHRIRTT